jgi:exopolyphosphatase/pppGpp-phosphohydrolase
MKLVKTTFVLLLAIGIASAQAQTGAAGSNKKAKAVQAHYYGAVDVGSKGTKAALYSFVAEEEGRNPVVIFTKTVNTKLVSSMAEGKFTKEGIADAADAVRQDVEAMRSEAGKRSVNVDVYYVVGSSGVAKGSNKDELVAAVKRATGLDMDFVDAAREGYYGLISSVPKSRRGSSMYIDIGSGNTKLGCLVGDSDLKNFKSAEIAFGSVSGRNEALKRNPKDVNAGIAALMSDVTDEYAKQSRDVPCLRNRQRVYWTGGAAWASATLSHPEKALSGWVTITKHDLETFQARLKDGTWNQAKPVFAFPKDMPEETKKAIRARAEKDREDVQNVFVREDMLSGVSIMNAVLESSNPAATIRFVRSGNYIYGYALEKFKEDNTE